MSFCIPKRIIQTGKNTVLPLKEQAAVCNVKLLNPDFEYMFFDDAAVRSFLDQEFPEYRAVFDSFPFPIQRYDFFRYLAVYRYGGFYFDLDMFLVSGLEGLLETGCVFSFEGLTYSRYLRNQLGMDWQLGNFAFGAAAGHPFLGAAIENCVRSQRDPRWVKPMMKGVPPLSKSEFFILHTTGPGMLSRTLAENPRLAREMTVLFPEDVCDPCSWNRFGNLGIHLMDGTWRERNGFLRRRLALYWEAQTLRKLIRQSLKLGKTRHVPRLA
jgi:hypothetical protein